MPEPVSILATVGLGWVVGGVVGNASDRQFAAVVRATKDRIAGLRGAPESQDVARAVRVAQMQALERVIKDYRDVSRPEWITEPHTRPDLFFQRGLDFCAPGVGRSKNPSVALNLEVTPALTAAIDGLLAPAAAGGPADRHVETVATFAEYAVLEELSEALNGVRLPDGFEEHFRNGYGSNPRFLDLFAVYIAEQIKNNQNFRAVLNSVQLARIESLAFDARELATRIEERFGAALDRVESKVDMVSADVRQVSADLHNLSALVLAAVSAQKGVPPEPLQAILGRFGEEGVPLDQIPERLAAKADELLVLREQWAKLATVYPDLADVQTQALALINKGDLAGARGLLSEARQRVRVSRQDRSKEESELLAREAEIDRLEIRYIQAADKYREAASLVGFDQEAEFGYLFSEARALLAQGDELGDNAALQRVVVVCEQALELKPRTADPRGWAVAQNILGAALTKMGERESHTESLGKAVVAFRAALEEYTRERVPSDWAMTQNNLAIVLKTLGEREIGTESLEEAAAAFRAALEVYTRERVPLDWAMIQNNLGVVLKTLGEREKSTKRLEDAAAAFRAALEERLRERVPLDWAATQNNLGNVLTRLGEREESKERLNEAVRIYRAALLERTRERVPLGWATTQNNLGSVLATLGELEGGTELLEQAVEAYRASLKERTRERVPLDWAATQNNLGTALSTLGERQGGTQRLEEAVEAFRAALSEYTRDFVPYNWAMTQFNLGEALMRLAIRERRVERVQMAVEAFRSAVEGFEQSSGTYYAEIARRRFVLASELLTGLMNQLRRS